MFQRTRYSLLILLLALLSACGGPQTAAPAVVSPAPTAVIATMPPLTNAPAPTTTPAMSDNELTVFAAASLTQAFKEIGAQFEAANEGATVIFSFAGSDQLATQIAQGAPADVFASANQKQMEVVIKADEIISGTERTFARNRLVIIYPNDNPAKLQTLTDLAKPGIKIVLASKSVPAGSYALDFLGKASQLPAYTAAYSETVIKNVVSYEENVKAVLTKVALGEADAGIVYTTDAATIKDGGIGTLNIPDNLNTIATYPIAATRSAKNANLAKRFVDYVLSPAGQQILVTYGFMPTTGSTTGGDG